MGLSTQFQQQQQQRFGSNGSLPMGGLAAFLAEEGAANGSMFQGMLHHAHTAPGTVGPVSPMAGMQQQGQAAQHDQQQQQLEPQYDTSTIADCPELLLKLKELPGPAVQQVGGDLWCLRWFSLVADMVQLGWHSLSGMQGP
jgi:hypothetical protein